jgi:hypothetical protein
MFKGGHYLCAQCALIHWTIGIPFYFYGLPLLYMYKDATPSVTEATSASYDFVSHYLTFSLSVMCPQYHPLSPGLGFEDPLSTVIIINECEMKTLF